MVFDMIPVDMASKAIVEIVKLDKEMNQNYHLYMEQAFNSENLCMWLQECGFQIDLDDPDMWFSKVKAVSQSIENSMSAKILPVIQANNSADILNKDFDITNTRKYDDERKDYSIKDEEDMFKKTIRFMECKGYFTLTKL